MARLLNEFNWLYPTVPTRVVFDANLGEGGPTAVYGEDDCAQQPVVMISLNPYASYMGVIDGLLQSLAKASFWRPGHGLPEDYDNCYNDLRGRELKFARVLSGARQLALARTVGGVN